MNCHLNAVASPVSIPIMELKTVIPHDSKSITQLRGSRRPRLDDANTRRLISNHKYDIIPYKTGYPVSFSKIDSIFNFSINIENLSP